MQKIPPEKLRDDVVLLKNILESKHPSLYWYTAKDSMDYYFKTYYDVIKDSMYEQQFAWKVLVPLVDKIHCGHTSVGMSKAYRKWTKGKRFPSFPLYLKVWSDTMAVNGNLNKKDSIFKLGTLITSINGVKNKELVRKIFDYLPEDGYANNYNYIKLSSNFPYYHRNVFGLSKSYRVAYIDSLGKEREVDLPLFTIKLDSTKKIKQPAAQPKKETREKRITRMRKLELDSNGRFAIMTLNTFNNGRLRRFYRQSFKILRQENITNLILDIRSNGGGRVGLSTLLTKYISRKPFRVADSLFAKTGTVKPYGRYIKGGFLNNVEMFFISKRNSDGFYHINHLEKKEYKLKNKNHYNGTVYILINGPTFSAATIFANAVKGQPGITLAGEETGGGWYGNNGIMIPDIVLPNSGSTVRLPLYRIVQYKHIAEKGIGIVPDWYIPTHYESLLKGADWKMELVKKRILNQSIANQDN